MTGLPDIATVNKSSTRDPFANKQHFIMNDLKLRILDIMINLHIQHLSLQGQIRKNNPQPPTLRQ